MIKSLLKFFFIFFLFLLLFYYNYYNYYNPSNSNSNNYHNLQYTQENSHNSHNSHNNNNNNNSNNDKIKENKEIIIRLINNINNEIDKFKQLKNNQNKKIIITKQEQKEQQKEIINSQNTLIIKNTKNQRDLQQEQDDDQNLIWLNKVRSKLECSKSNFGTIFFYHTRKAGGTTIREWLHTVSSLYHAQYYESEGNSLNSDILKLKGLISVISLRDPIERIFSLYWYEHVVWWYDVKREPKKCHSLRKWVEGWRDGNPWKEKFVRKYPGTVYVEVENYYVKSLIGWKGKEKIERKHLEQAKSILQNQFDLIILTEDLSTKSESEIGSFYIAKQLIGESTNQLQVRSNTGDSRIQTKLRNLLTNDKEQVRIILKEINQLDIELYEYAKTLIKNRKEFLQKGQSSPLQGKKNCDVYRGDLEVDYKDSVGLFRPIGHKGPLENFL